MLSKVDPTFLLEVWAGRAGSPGRRMSSLEQEISGLLSDLGFELVTFERAGRSQRIYPYTDLLLHDMGDGLADNRPEFQASGHEWRTPPLWGLGYAGEVAGTDAYYLHDGRARTLLEAILWHGGEAEAAKQSVIAMSTEERAQLIAFLESL